MAVSSNRRGGLGRGLAALIPASEGGDSVLREVPIDAISANPRQPRDGFDEQALEELAASIRDVGLLQPVVVRPLPGGRYELVAGERRVRACRMAGLERVPAIMRETGEEDLLKEALIENIHRVQLNPLEEAAAYGQLLDDFGITQEELAERLGKSRPTISNALRLLSLPPSVQRRVAAGVLTAGHAKALLAVEDPAELERLADKVVAESLTVRATEELVRSRLVQDQGSGRSTRRGRRPTAPGLADLQEELSDALRARVQIRMGSRKGRLQIEFASVDDLERIVGIIADGLRAAGGTATHAADVPVPRAPAGRSGSPSTSGEPGTPGPPVAERNHAHTVRDDPAGWPREPAEGTGRGGPGSPSEADGAPPAGGAPGTDSAPEDHAGPDAYRVPETRVGDDTTGSADRASTHSGAGDEVSTHGGPGVGEPVTAATLTAVDDASAPQDGEPGAEPTGDGTAAGREAEGSW